MQYVVIDGKEYLIGYDLAGSEISTSEDIKDAKLFDSKYEADYVAERIGFSVKEVK